MLKFCVPDVAKLDKFILGLDRLMFPLSAGPRPPTASPNRLNGLGAANRQAFLEQIVSHRCDLREEADSNVIITTLKWTVPGGVVFSLPPSNLLLINLIEAMRWSTLTTSSEARPIAESALRLDKFFGSWARQLVPRKEMQVEPKPGAGGESGPSRRQAVPDKSAKKAQVFAKSQLYVLERILFAIICLTNRFFETVLPTRLLESGLTQGSQSEGVVKLLERKLDSPEYVNNTAYWREPEFQQIYQNLSDYLVGLLANGQRLLEVLMTFDPVDRPIYIKRIITYTICLHCSRNLKSWPPTAANPRTALYNLQDCLGRLSRTLPCDEVRPILARTLGAERGIGPCIQNLTRLAEALGDPIRAVIDPLQWKRGNALGTTARASIPKTYVRLSNGVLETSETSDFGIVQNASSQKEVTPMIDDGDQEDTEPAEGDGDDFKATKRTLEEMEAEAKAASNNPMVWRYLMKWITRHRYEQCATKGLRATDKIAVLRIVKAEPDRKIRTVLLGTVCPALSLVSGSYHEKGSELLLDYRKDRNTLKAVLQASGKGSPTGWLKSFRPAEQTLTNAFKALRVRLSTTDRIQEELLDIEKQSRQLMIAVNEFDEEHKAVIDAYYKKKAAKAA